MATTTNSKIIQATKEKIYHAFTDKKALESWLAPNGMVGKIHDFHLQAGGGYQMSLFYLNEQTLGKTSGSEDRFSAKFVELIPYSKVVQTINFLSDKIEFADEMTMEVFLESVSHNSTNVTIVFRNIPPGINPKDNETGTEQSLEKLASYIEENRG